MWRLSVAYRTRLSNTADDNIRQNDYGYILYTATIAFVTLVILSVG